MAQLLELAKKWILKEPNKETSNDSITVPASIASDDIKKTIDALPAQVSDKVYEKIKEELLKELQEKTAITVIEKEKEQDKDVDDELGTILYLMLFFASLLIAIIGSLIVSVNLIPEHDRFNCITGGLGIYITVLGIVNVIRSLACIMEKDIKTAGNRALSNKLVLNLNNRIISIKTQISDGFLSILKKARIIIVALSLAVSFVAFFLVRNNLVSFIYYGAIILSIVFGLSIPGYIKRIKESGKSGRFNMISMVIAVISVLVGIASLVVGVKSLTMGTAIEDSEAKCIVCDGPATYALISDQNEVYYCKKHFKVYIKKEDIFVNGTNGPRRMPE